MQTMTSPNVSELVQKIKDEVESSKQQLLKTFEFVPDEKLTWTPGEPARSAVQIVSHCGMANNAFAAIIRGEKLEVPEDRDERAKLIREAGKDITSRDEAVRLLNDSCAQVTQALDQVTPESLASSPESPFGPVPFTFWMNLPATHMGGHSNQIDYIQTCWGDLEEHSR